jgi:hypothetical protein
MKRAQLYSWLYLRVRKSFEFLQDPNETNIIFLGPLIVNALLLHYDEIVDIVGRGGSEGLVSK